MINASGIGVYLRECLPILLNSAHSFLLLGNEDLLSSFQKNNTVIIDCKIKPFSIRELLWFPKKILKKINSADSFYSPFFNVPHGIKVPVFTTIHDIIFPDMPELVSKTGLIARMFFFRRAYKKSTKIFTVSLFSKSRIEHHLGKAKPIIVTYSAIQSIFLAQRKRTQTIEKKQTIVFVGNIKKHKGLDCLLDAFVKAKKSGLQHKLVIIGSKNNFRSSDNAILGKIDALEDNSVLFTGYVSDAELAVHLSEAALLVQPSLYEGFCLPPLEAMILGTHALVSDIPVLKEVYADFPVTFFRAGDSGDLSNRMNELLINRKQIKVNLPEQLAKKYTFEKTAGIVLENLVQA